MTAVFGAVQGDNLELIKYLESKGADLTVKSTKGGLVQHASSAHKAPKCLSYFMEKKLEVDTYDESGQSALYRLCFSYLANKKDEKKQKSLLDSMKKLIDAGADPNVLSKRDEKEETPLHLICNFDSTCEELIKFLLDNGANPNIKSSRDDTPLLRMFYLKREQGSRSRKVVSKRCLEIMFQHKADPNIPNKSGITPFLYLMSSHIYHQVKTDIELVKLFLENGADVTSVDFKRNTPLHLAAEKAYSEVCKLLIDYKADVNAMNANKESPIFSVARSEASPTASKETLEMLIANGAKIEPNSDGDYPHFVASKCNKIKIIVCMIQNGIERHILDQEGNAFMHILANDYENKADGTADTVELGYMKDFIDKSLQNSLNFHLKNNDGKNFYDIIFPKLNDTDKGNLEGILKKKGYDINETGTSR